MQFHVLPKYNREIDENLLPPLPKKYDLRISKNYRGITLTAITATIYYDLLFSHISNQNSRKFFRKIRMDLGEKIKAMLLFVDFSKAFDSIPSGKIMQMLLAYGLPKETVITIMMFNKNAKAIVCSIDDDTDFLTLSLESCK